MATSSSQLSTWTNPSQMAGKKKTTPAQAYRQYIRAAQRNAYLKYVQAAKNKQQPTEPDYGNPVPDTTFEVGGRAIKTGRDNTLSSIAAQRVALNESYGFDPNTGTFAENVDVTNPYSRAALLNQAYKRNQAQSQMSYANRGALTSGAYLAAMQSDANDFNQSRKNLEADFTARRQDFLAQENAANNNYDTRMNDLRQELMQRRMAEDAPTYSKGDKPSPKTPAPPPMNDFLKGILDSLKPKEPKGKGKSRGGKNKSKGKK